MSNETFNLSSEQHHVRSRSGSSSHRGLRLSLSPGDWNGNSVPGLGASSSPDSPSSLSSLSDADNQSPHDVDMPECGLSEGNNSPILTRSTFVVPSEPNDTTPSEEDRQLNHTFISTPVNTNGNVWNETITIVTSSLEGGEGESGCSYLEPRGDGTERENSLDSGEASLGGSDENNCPFEEMAMRNNTFCLEDQSLTLSMLQQSDSSPSSFSQSVLLPELQRTYSTSLLDSCPDSWNQAVTVVLSSTERPCEGMQKVGSDTETAADSAEKGSGEVSCSGYCQNNCCSLSSGEMVMRANSFCLEDQSLPLTFLEESVYSPALDSPALTKEVSQLSATVPDQLEKGRPTEGVIGENVGPQHFGLSFIESHDQDLSTASKRMEASSSSPMPLPNESEGEHLRTFLCDPDPKVFGVESPALGEPQPCPSESSTSEANQTFVLPASGVLSPDNVQTSTPVQNTGNNHVSFTSLSESPCLENTGSPVCRPTREKKSTSRGVTPKPRLVARLRPSAIGVSKTEIRRFPKPDFSSVRPKILTRPANQLAIAGNGLTKATLHKQPYVSMPSRANKSIKTAHTRDMNSTTIITTSAKETIDNVQPEPVEGNSGPSNFGMTGILSDQNLCSAGAAAAGSMSGAEEGEQRATLTGSLSAEPKLALTALPETERAARASPAQCHGNQTFTFPLPAESPSGVDPLHLKTSPTVASLKKVEVLTRDGNRRGLGSTQDKPPLPNTRSRCVSESTSSSKLPRETRSSPNSSASFSTSKGQSKPGAQSRSSQSKCPKQPEPGARKGAPYYPGREIRKINLMPASPKSSVIGAPGTTSEGGRSRLGARPSPSNPRRAIASQAASTCPSPSPIPGPSQRPASRWRPGGPEKGTSIPKGLEPPLSKQSSTSGVQRAQTASEGSVGNGSRPPHNPNRSSAMGHQSIPASRLLLKGNPRKVLSNSSERSGSSGTTQGTKTPAPAKQGALNSGASPLKRTASSRLGHPTKTLPVDRNRPKAGPRSQQEQPPPPPAPPASNGRGPDVVPTEGRAARGSVDHQADCERSDRSLQQLRGLLTASDCRFEAVSVVLQRTLSERDEALKQRRELSQELVTLRGELVSSANSCERLVREKEDVQAALEELLQKVREQHQDELAQLEQRLQVFYQAEWDKVHRTYQEEADKCKALMEQQMNELRATHETVKLELEMSHSEQLHGVKKLCEQSLEELRKAHEQELQTLDKTLKETEATLCEQIEELTAENKVFSERILAEEARRKALAEKNQVDSHTLYLEQELESLKVVLDIKNKQLHQQDKKLMQIDKLVEKNVKLEECFQKVRQENEDYRARMDRHAALSRQLSTEQAVLQESLQKESKVNKRLSMENEELMWKLHNGDLSSPRKMSPSSASTSLSLQSPRSSAVFSSPPISPR